MDNKWKKGLCIFLVLAMLAPNVNGLWADNGQAQDMDRQESAQEAPGGSEEIQEEQHATPGPAVEPSGTPSVPRRESGIDWTGSTENVAVSLGGIVYQQDTGSVETASLSGGQIDLSSMEIEDSSALELDYSFSFSSQEDGKGNKVQKGDTLQIAIPSCLEVEASSEAEGILNNEGEKIGSYSISGRTAVVTFEDVDLVTEISGTLKINAELKKTDLKETPIESTVTLQQPAGGEAVKVTLLLPALPSQNKTQGTEPDKTPDSQLEEPGEGYVEAPKPEKKSISSFNIFAAAGSGGQKTVTKKTYKKPGKGITKAVVQVESKKEGYRKDDTDLGVNFGMDLTLDSDYLYSQLEEVANTRLDYPEFQAGMDWDEYNAKVDGYLNGLTDTVLEPISYSYDLGPDFTIEADRNGVPQPLTLSEGEKIGTLTVSKTPGGSCVAEVVFEKKIANRERVAAGMNIGLLVDQAALDESEPVFVGWKDEQLVVETSGVLDPGGPNTPAVPDYSISKSAPARVDTPYIDYTIEVNAEKEGRTLKNMVLEDVLPKAKETDSVILEVSSVALGGVTAEKGNGLEPGKYTVENGTLKYLFPEDTEAVEAEFTVRLALTPEAYRAAMESGGIAYTFANTASLRFKDGSMAAETTESADTAMSLQLMAKDGRQEGMNGLRYSWTLDINTQFSELVNGYVVDTICWDDHMYDGSAGLQVYVDGRFSETISFGKKDISDPVSYEDLNKGNISAIVNGATAPFYYTYTKSVPGEDGGEARNKTYAVLVIPFSGDYQNHKVKFKYFTEINRNGQTVEEWLGTQHGQTKTITNDAKFIWERFIYGAGPGWDDFTYSVNLEKQVGTNVTLGTKSSGRYEESTQQMEWKFSLNGYGAHMTETTVADTLSPTQYDPDSIQITYEKYDNTSKESLTNGPQPVVEGGEGINYAFDQNTGAVKISVSEIQATEYYEITIKAKLIDPSILVKQGIRAGILTNSAQVFAIVNGKETTSDLEARKEIPNTLISKKAVGEYDYGTRELNWKTTMDMNFLPIDQAVLTDELPVGNSFGELKKVTRVHRADDGALTQTEAAMTGTGGTASAGFPDGLTVRLGISLGTTAEGYRKDTVTFTFSGYQGQPCTDSFIFEYTTNLVDDKYVIAAFTASATDSIDVENQVRLAGQIRGEQIDASAEAAAALAVKENLIVKNGKYLKTDGTIHWGITFNQDKRNIGKMMLIEEIGSQPLEIDVDSLRLYELADTENVLKNSADSKDWLRTLDSKNIVYVIPEEYKTKTLRLEFDTVLTESAPADGIHNSVRLMNGDQVYQESASSDGGYDGDFDIDDYIMASMKPVFQIMKTSSNDDTTTQKKPLAGAEFKLTAYAKDSSGDGYTNEAGLYSKKGTTNKDGKLTFVNLKVGYVYKLTETEAPSGYELDATPHYYLFAEGADDSGSIQQTMNVGGSPNVQVVCLNRGSQENAVFIDNSLTINDTPSSKMKVGFLKTKPDASSPLAGAEFALEDKSGYLKDKIARSDDKGDVSFEKVDPGEYILRELSSDIPYDQGAAFDVKVEADGSFTISNCQGNAALTGDNGSYTISNQYAKGTIVIRKEDSETGNIPLAGGEFTLYKADGQTPVTNGEGNVIKAVSNADGKAVFKDIPIAEENYVIKETNAPDGYELPDDTLKITITPQRMTDALVAAGIQKEGEAKKFTLDLSAGDGKLQNKRAKGSITLTKQNSNGVPMSGRTFKLFYDDSDGYSGWSKGALVKESTTDDSGKLLFEDVPYGNYKLEEVMPAGDPYQPFSQEFHTLRDNIKSELEANRGDADPSNDDSFAVEITEPIKNSLLESELTLHKVDASTKENLEGVHFKLVGTDADGNNIDAEAVTDADGKVTFKNIPISQESGTKPYTLTETAVAGYQNPTRYHVYVKPVNRGESGSIDNHAEVTVVPLAPDGTEDGGRKEDATAKAYEIDNVPITGELEFSKVSSGVGKSVLRDAEFKLYRLVDGVRNEDTVGSLAPKTAVSDENGQVKFADVEFGNYELVETKAPKGFRLDGAARKITKAQLATRLSGDTFTYPAADAKEIKNEPTALNINKTDQFGNPVAGAHLRLQGKFAGGLDSIAWETDSEDSGLSNDIAGELIAGEEYVLTETAAPDNGLYKVAAPVKFVVGEDGATLTVTWGNPEDYRYSGDTDQLTVIDRYYLADVELTKRDAYTENSAIANVDFSLYQQQGSQPDVNTDSKIAESLTTDSTGKIKLSSLPDGVKNPVTKAPLNKGLSLGTYYFIEISAPDSYVCDPKPLPFRVTEGDDNHTITVEAENRPVNAAVRLKKLDSEDGSGIPDTEFVLYKNGSAGGTSYITEKAGKTVSHIDGNGKAKNIELAKGELFIDGLSKGQYRLEEITANSSYEAAGGMFSCSFEVTDSCGSGAVLEINGNSADGVFHLQKSAGTWSSQGVLNNRKAGRVSLTKKGLRKQGDTGEVPLAGAVFGLYESATDKQVMKDGSPLTGITDAQGKLVFEGLKWNEYYLKEIKPPAGYALDGQKYQFIVGYGKLEKEFSVQSGEGDVLNYQTVFTIEKKGGDTGQQIKGAVFALAGNFDGQPNSEKTYSMTDAGSLTVYGDLLAGETYVLSEITVPDGYQPAEDITLSISNEGKISVGGEALGDNLITVTDLPIEIKLRKADEGYPQWSLPGAEFELTDATAGTPAQKVVTGKNGVVLGGLVQGHEYTLEEKAAPLGYTVSAPMFSFRVTAQGTAEFRETETVVGSGTNLVTVKDKPIQLLVRKNNHDKEPLAGCEFDVTGVFAKAPQDRAHLIESRALPDLLDGQPAEDEETILVTDANHMTALRGRLIIGNTYTLKEHKPPDGYEIGGKVIFSVNDDGSIRTEPSSEYQFDPVTGTITMEDDIIEVFLEKTDMEGQILDGAVFKLEGPIAKQTEDVLVVRPKDKKPADLSGKLIESPEGTDYALTETEAPPGYAKMGSTVKFKVKSGGVVEMDHQTDKEMVTVTEADDKFTIHVKNRRYDPPVTTTPPATETPSVTPAESPSTTPGPTETPAVTPTGTPDPSISPEPEPSGAPTPGSSGTPVPKPSQTPPPEDSGTPSPGSPAGPSNGSGPGTGGSSILRPALSSETSTSSNTRTLSRRVKTGDESDVWQYLAAALLAAWAAVMILASMIKKKKQ